jgi:hypothetical protein
MTKHEQSLMTYGFGLITGAILGIFFTYQICNHSKTSIIYHPSHRLSQRFKVYITSVGIDTIACDTIYPRF